MAGGSYSSSALTAVDAKSRVSVPPAFREIIVANSTEREVQVGPAEHDDCLIAYDPRYEAKLQAQIERRFGDDFGPARAALHRDTFGSVARLKIDDAHRVVLSKSLRDVLETERWVYFLGAGEYFEIWNPHKLLASPNASPRVARLLRADLERAEAGR